jgi:hypothetical protein
LRRNEGSVTFRAVVAAYGNEADSLLPSFLISPFSIVSRLAWSTLALFVVLAQPAGAQDLPDAAPADSARVAICEAVEDPGPEGAAFEAGTPEATAWHLFAAYRANDLRRAAACMHPEALDRLKAFLVDIATLDPQGGFASMFVGASDVEAVRALPPPEAFARFIGTVMRLEPEMGNAFQSLDVDVLGHVVEGDTLAHVVTRSHVTVKGLDVTQTEVVSMKAYEGEWRALLSGDIEMMAKAMRSHLQDATEE